MEEEEEEYENEKKKKKKKKGELHRGSREGELRESKWRLPSYRIYFKVFIPSSFNQFRHRFDIIIMLVSKFNKVFAFSKIYTDPLQAIKGVTDGSFLLVGGFGFCGVPMNLVNALRLSKANNLVIASNSCGVDGATLEDDWGLSMLLRTHQIKRLIFSHLGENQ